jgi:CheY-like chemotaxis protein
MAVILVVDDDPNTRKLLVTLLGCHGHRLLQAGGRKRGDILNSRKTVQDVPILPHSPRVG